MNRGRHRKQNEHLNNHLVVQILGKIIANRMMQCQKEQGNLPNLDIFLNCPTSSKIGNGFNWHDTSEGWEYWNDKLAEYFRNHSLYLKYQDDRRKGFY